MRQLFHEKAENGAADSIWVDAVLVTFFLEVLFRQTFIDKNRHCSEHAYNNSLLWYPNGSITVSSIAAEESKLHLHYTQIDNNKWYTMTVTLNRLRLRHSRFNITAAPSRCSLWAPCVVLGGGAPRHECNDCSTHQNILCKKRAQSGHFRQSSVGEPLIYSSMSCVPVLLCLFYLTSIVS